MESLGCQRRGDFSVFPPLIIRLVYEIIGNMASPKNTVIPGFEFAGMSCGIKDKNKKDLAVILSQASQTTVAGMFTKNRVCAAPVKICQKHVKKNQVKAIVINSGNANAATGTRGFKDSQKICEAVAKKFALKSFQVLPCSTGKIGVPLPMGKIISGIKNIKPRANGFLDCVKAICTTDAYIKTAVHHGKIDGKKFTIAVMAKGAGMIHPKMATMLCYIVTDLKIQNPVLKNLLKESVDQTLNCLSVDGDTSTNDTVLMMASGVCGNKDFKTDSSTYKRIQKTLTNLLEEIAILIAKDGEGATKCLRIHVSEAASQKDAQKVAKTIVNSPLVKTAMFGCDPNWGRILAAIGYAGARVDEGETVIKLGAIPVFSKGKPLGKNEKRASVYLRKNQIVDVFVFLGMGKAHAKTYGSDLTYDYVKLNAMYHT